MDIKKRIQELSLDQKAKLYFMGLVRQGKIDTLPEDPKAAYIKMVMDKADPADMHDDPGDIRIDHDYYTEEKDDYGRSISGKDKRTFVDPKDLTPAARAKKMAGLKETATELGYLNEEEMYGFTVKGANFTYTEQGNMFYGVYLYDVPATANVQWKEKIRYADEATKWLQSLGIQETVPRRYDEDTLDKIVMMLKNKGIMADHDNFFDVS